MWPFSRGNFLKDSTLLLMTADRRIEGDLHIYMLSEARERSQRFRMQYGGT